MPTMTMDQGLSAVEIVLENHTPIGLHHINVGGIDAVGVTCKCGWNGKLAHLPLHQAEKVNSAPHIHITVGAPA